MRLLGCHIENFGVFSDFDLEFNKGINVLYEANGFGKSTLATFLRVMFYGFDNENKRDELVNERQHYKPWQGGVYGGSVTVETDMGRLIINRTFGNKEAEDTFEVRDAETFLCSEKFGKNIGEVIFGIDSESFKRSVMLSQNDCETRPTDGISAKLGNLTEVTDDINNFEAVDEQLKKLINSMSDSKKTGSRYKLNNNVFEIENELRSRTSIEKRLTESLELLENEENNIRLYKKRIAELEESRNDEAVNVGLYSIKEHYERLIESKKESEREINDTKDKFNMFSYVFDGQLPSDEELFAVSDNISLLSNMKEKKYAEDVSVSEYEDYMRLAESFGSNENVAGDLDRAMEIIAELEENERSLSAVDYQRKHFRTDNKPSNAKTRVLWGVVSLLFSVLLGTITYILFKNEYVAETLAIFAGATAVVLLIVSAVMIITAVNGLNAGKRRREELNEICNSQDLLKKERNRLKSGLNAIISKYGMTFDKYNTGRQICRMRDDYDYYCRLASRIDVKEKEQTGIGISELTSLIEGFFKRYESIVSGRNYFEKLYSLKAAVQEYLMICEKRVQFDAVCREISAVENRGDFERILAAYNPGLPDSDAAYTTEREKLNTEIDSAMIRCETYRKNIAEAEEDIDALSDKEERLKNLREELEEQNDRANIYELTRRFLNEAKTAFVKKYSAPIANNFTKYYQIIDGNGFENYSFDANTNLCVYCGGRIRKPEILSRGMRDLAGIMFRMALIDVMYESEKPYIIMDDPFVNLDDLRLNGAKKLINYISQEYQVIYFTCSSSRIPRIKSD